jgi:hypothetical protein
MRKQANWKAANTTKRLAAIGADVPDLNRQNIAIPTTDAKLTTIVIAISSGEKCPLITWDTPSK